MDRWQDKIAVVTGASSGIGEAICEDFLKNGLIVVGLARRLERLEENKLKLPENLQSRFFPIKCDVTIESDVKNVFDGICEEHGGIDILINNAGLLREGFLATMDAEIIRNVLDTNVMAIVYCTREAFKSMKARNFNGHVVLINSVAGHKVLYMDKEMPSFNIYPPSKFAVTAMTEIYRQEFSKLDTKVKITSVSPGLVQTEMTTDFCEQNSNYLKAKDISDAVMYCIGTPPHVQIHEITVKAVGEMF